MVDYNFLQFVGDPVLYIQQFILMAHVSPWRPHLQNSLVIKEALKPGFNITKHITDFQHKQGYDFTTTTTTKNRVPRPTNRLHCYHDLFISYYQLHRYG